MFIKALYVSDLHSYMDKTISQLEQVHTQVNNIQKRIEGIIALEDAFKGKTAPFYSNLLSRGAHAVSVVPRRFYYELLQYFTGNEKVGSRHGTKQRWGYS